MLRDPHLTDGIGVRTAHSILGTFIHDALKGQVLISVTSAEQGKQSKNAQSAEELNRIMKVHPSHIAVAFFWFTQLILGLLDITSARVFYGFSEESEGQD